jgi:hypothetical protein
VIAVDREDARKKAEKRFPLIWCGWKLAEIIVEPFNGVYKTIKVDQLLDANMPILG